MFVGQTGRWKGIACTLGLLICSTSQAEPSGQLLTRDQPSREAVFVGCDSNGAFQFRVDGEVRQVEKDDLVRWSNPRVDLRKSELVLVGGSRLVIAKSWTGQSSLQMDAETVSIATNLLGQVSVPRDQVRAILWNAPAENMRRDRLLKKLLAFTDNQDRLVMTGGDVFVGQFLPSKSENVAGVAFRKNAEFRSKRDLALGLRDGSYLIVDRLQVKQSGYELKLASGISLAGTASEDIVYLQALSRPTYLSDLEPVEYQHQSYLDIPWPYRRDQNLRGGPLRVGGRIYPKGIAMHSESRLTYDIPPIQANPAENEFKQLVAEVALDDLAASGGSVVFQVLLRHDDDWQTVYSSPVVRGGDPPLAVRVQLHGAKQITLVAEYADRGDERDHANWLDARFE